MRMSCAGRLLCGRVGCGWGFDAGLRGGHGGRGRA